MDWRFSPKSYFSLLLRLRECSDVPLISSLSKFKTIGNGFLKDLKLRPLRI